MELIDRDALLKKIRSWDIDMDDIKSDMGIGYHNGIQRAVCMANKAPTVDAEPVRNGKWISYPDCGVTKCSQCGWNVEEAWYSNFCPNCGAKMDKE